jgi:hypothetical protein
MSEEEKINDMTYIRVSYGNIERIKAVGKMGDSLNDVVTMLLDYYEDLHCHDWVNTKSNENQHKERSCGCMKALLHKAANLS